MGGREGGGGGVGVEECGVGVEECGVGVDWTSEECVRRSLRTISGVGDLRKEVTPLSKLLYKTLNYSIQYGIYQTDHFTDHFTGA